MKKQIKRFSKSTLAVVLSLCILMSCAAVGIIATNAVSFAAKGAAAAAVGAGAGENAVGAAVDSESVGASGSTFYYRGEDNVWGSTELVNVSGTNFYYYNKELTSATGRFKITDNTNWSGQEYYSIDDNMSSFSTDNGAKDNVTGTHYILFNSSTDRVSYTTHNPATTYTIYIKNTKNWSNIYLYPFNPREVAWGSSPQVVSSGSAVSTKYTVSTLDDNGTTIYKVEGLFPSDKIIIKNAVGDTSNKTGDLNLVNGALYNTGTNSNTDGTIENNSYVEPVPETKFNVTVNQGAHGTVSPSSVNAGETAVDLSSAVTVTPAGGWTHTGWTATSPASVSGNNLTATGTGGSVTPTYARIPCYVYGDIDGVNEWSNTTAHAMTYDSTTGYYYYDIAGSSNGYTEYVQFNYSEKIWSANQNANTPMPTTQPNSGNTWRDSNQKKPFYFTAAVGHSYRIWVDPSTVDSTGDGLMVWMTDTQETTCTVTVKSGAGTFTSAGNNTDQTVSAGEHISAALPEVTAPSGKKFKEWTVTTGSVTLSNATLNGSATVNATSAGTVTATYEDISDTTVYIAKGTNVKYIYAWYNDGSNHNITDAFPGQQIENTTTYNFGGIAYYKYTFNRDISTFNFIISDGTNSHQSSNATGYAAGGTYYVQWSGGNNTAVSDMTTGSTYPNYILRYQPTSEDPNNGTWTSVQFTDSAATISNLAQGSYRFFIVRQDMNNGSYADAQWYNNGSASVTRVSRENIYCNHAGTNNISFSADATGNYTFNMISFNGNDGVTLDINYPSSGRSFYLTGWLNKGSVTTTDASRKFTETSAGSGIYTLDYTFTDNQGGYQYATIYDGTNAYHPATHESGSGTAGTTVNTSPGNDPKWKVGATTDQTAHFTWDTTGANPTLSWTIDALATRYRVVGSASYFGTAWDTSTSSSSYNWMMVSGSGTYDGMTYDYVSGPHTATKDYSSFDFKVWGSDSTWYPGSNVNVPGLKKDQQIKFYFDSSTDGVKYEIIGAGTDDPWPPTDIQSKSLGNVRYDSLIYNISGGSNNITTNKSTLSGLQQETGSPDGWWADFTDLLPNIGTDQLYFNITSNGNYTGFYATSNMTFDTTNAPGISVKKVDKDSSKYYVEVSGVDSALTHLGVYITKDGSNNFTYKFYTVKGSTSGGKTVKVYAKDGSIRRLGTSRNPGSNMTYSTFEQHANTFLCADNNYNTRLDGAGRASTHGASSTDEWTDSTTFDRYTYDYAAGVTKGSTIYIKTVLKNDDYMNQYYLAGYSINGTTYVEHTVAESQTGTVTESFEIPEDWEWNYVEITPIYFLRDSSNTIKFYVEGYDQTVMDAGWGNTVGVYPYYQDPTNNSQVANVNNPFGGYPGQPLMFYKGNYYAVLPKSYQAYTEAHSSGEKVNCEIKGITLSNMYWDDVHLYTGEVNGHFQTYDFDDLYKIYKEYGNDVNNIICAFKYRTKKNNDEPNSVTPANYTNGWEVLKDYYGNPIDVFGNQLTGNALTDANAITTPEEAQNASGVVRVISQDYKSNCAGQYATEYAIYDTTGAQVKVSGGKSTIVPSALAIKTADNFDNYDPATKAFKAIYQALDNNSNVKGKPVVITYEKSIYGGGDKADRCDARWFFSKRGEEVNATTRIEYSDDLGATWTTDSFNSGTATGSHTGSTAYFTGLSTAADNDPETAAGNTTTTDTSANAQLTPRIGEGYYVFNATAGAQYEFVGWYILRENYQQNADKNHLTSHAEIAKDGDIFVARFVKTAHGSFTINHKLHPQSSGFGDVYVQATVKNSGNTLYTIGSVDPNNNPTSTVTIEKDGNNNDLIVSGHGNIIEAKFVPDPYGTSSFVNFYATINDLLNGYTGYDFIKSIEINMPGVDGYVAANGIYALVTYDVDKMFAASSGTPTQIYTSVTHYSKFALKTDIAYSLSYKFSTRYYGDKLYNYSSTYTEEELRSYYYDKITDKAITTIDLDAQFVYSKAPQESNFRQDLTWRIADFTIENNVGKMTAYQVDKKTVDGVVYDSEISGDTYAEVTKRMTTGYMKLFSINANATDETAEAFAPSDNDLYRPNRTTYLDSGVEKPVYIHHWNMYQLDTFSYDGFDEIGNLIVSDKAKLVAQSYSSKMNYVGFEDYAIVPVYSTELVNRQEISDNRTDASATLLSITRNHWNTTTSGEADDYGHYDAPNTNYDRLYVDFMLNYNYSTTVDGKKQNIMLSKTGENIKVGFVVKSYTVVNGVKDYRTGKSQTVLVDKSKIDDKNRLEYCYGFNNTQNNSQWGLNFEFTPFIVDTSVQTTESAALINISGTNYKTLYPATDFTCLDGVTFYMIGKADTDWA